MKIFIAYINNNKGIKYLDLLRHFDKFVGNSYKDEVDQDYNNLKMLDCFNKNVRYGFMKICCKKSNGKLSYIGLPFDFKKQYRVPVFVSIYYR